MSGEGSQLERAHEAMPEKDNAETRSPQRFRRADGGIWEAYPHPRVFLQ